jgi:hypothetical protein
MSKFSENRKYLFGNLSSLSPNSTSLWPLAPSNSNRKVNWIQNLIKISNERSIPETHKKVISKTVFAEVIYEKCCQLNHIENFTTEEKNSILKYFNSIRYDHNRADEYLKRHTFVQKRFLYLWVTIAKCVDYL